MDICVLSEQKQNLLFCYKIAKITNNIFTIKEQCNIFKLKINDNFEYVNFWTVYNNKQNNCYILILKEQDVQVFQNKMLEIIKNITNIDPHFKFILLVNLYDPETKNIINVRPIEYIKELFNNNVKKIKKQYKKKRNENSSDLLIIDENNISSYISLQQYINKKNIEFIDNDKNNFIEPFVFACCHNIRSIAIDMYNDNHIVKIIDIIHNIL